MSHLAGSIPHSPLLLHLKVDISQHSYPSSGRALTQGSFTSQKISAPQQLWKCTEVSDINRGLLEGLVSYFVGGVQCVLANSSCTSKADLVLFCNKPTYIALKLDFLWYGKWWGNAMESGIWQLMLYHLLMSKSQWMFSTQLAVYNFLTTL